MEICLPGFEVHVKMPERCEPDMVNHPAHYCVGGLECFDVMKRVFGTEAAKIFCRLNAFKYMFRSENKNGEQDIAKANWYTAKYLELCKESVQEPEGLEDPKRAELVAAINNLVEVATRRDVMPDEADPEEYYQDLDALAEAEARIYHLFGTKADWELAMEAREKEKAK